VNRVILSRAPRLRLHAPETIRVDETRDPGVEALAHARTGRVRKSTFLLIVRRIHLYSGLALLPWVLLYGVTALLFNHPGLVSPREVRDLAPLAAGTFADELDPDALAHAVVDALRARAAADADSTIAASAFGEPRAARTSGSLRYALREERTGELGRDHVLEVDAEARRAKLYSTPAPAKPAPAPFAVKRDLALAEDPLAAGQESARQLLAGLGIDAEPAGCRSAPTLEFELPVSGETWLATYALRERSLSAIPLASAPEPLSTRTFLTRLHTAHGFTPARGSEWTWAWIVDAMGVTMVFWAVSGVLMWWQMRKTRVIGGLVVAGSIAAAVLLAAGMYASLV